MWFTHCNFLAILLFEIIKKKLIRVCYKFMWLPCNLNATRAHTFRRRHAARTNKC